MNWIKVKEKLPPDDSDVIVWCAGGYFECVAFNSASYEETRNRFVLYENGGEYTHDLTGNVTHWAFVEKPQD